MAASTGAPRLAIAAAELETACRTGLGTRVCQLEIAAHGGNAISRNGFFTGWFGGLPFFVSGGGVATYAVDYGGGTLITAGSSEHVSKLCRIRHVAKGDRGCS